MQITIISVFLAGLANFFAPCTFATLPVFITFLSAQIGELSDSKAKSNLKKHILLRNVALYILGFSLVFVLLGIGIYSISRTLVINRQVFVKLGGLFLIFSSLISLYGHKFKNISIIFAKSKKIVINPEKVNSMMLPFVLGAVNSFSWTFCTGPIHGYIMYLASSQNTLLEGIFLLTIYTLSMSLPIVIFALFFERLLPFFKKISKYSRIIYKGGLISILIIGICFATGWYGPVFAFLTRLFRLINVTQ